MNADTTPDLLTDPFPESQKTVAGHVAEILDACRRSTTDVLLDAWDAKPDDRIRRTSSHPAPTRRPRY